MALKISDVKYLLASHAHSDHVAGHAKMREFSGAKVLVMEGDDGVIAAGGAGQYFYADSRWPECPVDRVLKDGDKVTLGKVTLVARRTPGHTRGCTTWTWQETVDGKSLDVVVIGSPNVNPGYRLVDNADYPKIADDYTQTFALLKSLPCDVFLGAHGNYYDLPAKDERLVKKEPGNPFIDPQGYRAYVALKEEAFRKKLADQKAGPIDEAAAALHLARTVCRRAERRLFSLAQTADHVVRPDLVIYLNRLGDLLFVLARYANLSAGQADVPWQKRNP